MCGMLVENSSILPGTRQVLQFKYLLIRIRKVVHFGYEVLMETHHAPEHQ
jgi:hypothetical protein